jgi:hypothetical protein
MAAGRTLALFVERRNGSFVGLHDLQKSLKPQSSSSPKPRTTIPTAFLSRDATTSRVLQEPGFLDGEGRGSVLVIQKERLEEQGASCLSRREGRSESEQRRLFPTWRRRLTSTGMSGARSVHNRRRGRRGGSSLSDKRGVEKRTQVTYATHRSQRDPEVAHRCKVRTPT